MKRAIVGCGIIKRDIEHLLNDLPYEADIFWLDEKLHEFPENLNKVLQEKIDELTDYDEIILAYMLCGNGLLGIKSNNARLRFIKGDDCIYANLCHRADYADLRRSSIFLSHGWLSTTRNSLAEYERSLEKYGERRTKLIYETMYKNYKHVAYMKLDDTISEEDKQKVEQMAGIMNVEPIYVDGSLELFKDLFYLRENDKICVLEIGKEVTTELFTEK